MCVCVFSKPSVSLLQRWFRKGSVDLVHAMKVYIRSRGEVPLILNLRTGRKWVVYHAPADLTSGIKKPGSPALVACVGPTVHVNGSIKKGSFTLLQQRIKTWLPWNTALSFPLHTLSSFSKLNNITVGTASLNNAWMINIASIEVCVLFCSVLLYFSCNAGLY